MMSPWHSAEALFDRHLICASATECEIALDVVHPHLEAMHAV